MQAGRLPRRRHVLLLPVLGRYILGLLFIRKDEISATSSSLTRSCSFCFLAPHSAFYPGTLCDVSWRWIYPSFHAAWMAHIGFTLFLQACCFTAGVYQLYVTLRYARQHENVRFSMSSLSLFFLLLCSATQKLVAGKHSASQLSRTLSSHLVAHVRVTAPTAVVCFFSLSRMAVVRLALYVVDPFSERGILSQGASAALFFMAPIVWLMAAFALSLYWCVPSLPFPPCARYIGISNFILSGLSCSE